MKRLVFRLLVMTTLLELCSCAEDRTYQYEEKTQHNQWMYDVMLDKYLWADALATYEPTWKNFFATPASFMSALTTKAGKGDKWSYVEVDTVKSDSYERGMFNHLNSYGVDFVLMTDPTGQTTKSVLRVLTVYPDSPAERAGLLRNDFICSYDGYKISSSNVEKLQKGIARRLDVCHIAVDELEGAFYWADTVEVALEASEYVEDVAFPVYNMIKMNDTLVGYVMCTRLVPHALEQGEGRIDDAPYSVRLEQIMSQMKSSGVKELVLDLRLCNYGTLDMTQQLASSVVAPQYLGTTFVSTLRNEGHASENATWVYDAAATNLSLSRVYVLTSSYTRGAAEWLIRALQATMGEENVVTIGTKTAGQDVMTEEVGHEFYVRLCPVVAYVADCDGNYGYGSLTPTVEVDEMSYATLDDYGSPSEILLYTAIQHIRGFGQNDSEKGEESDKSAEVETVE